MPHRFAVGAGPGAVEEERRLLYVGVTRAGAALYLSRAEKRGGGRREASRFLRTARWD